MSLFATLLGPVTNAFTSYNKGKNELKMLDLDIKKAEKENRAHLLRDKESNNAAWERQSLVSSDKWLKRFAFVIFFWPLSPVIIWYPELVVRYYDALSLVPMWWQQVVIGIVGSVFGLAALKNGLPAVLSIFKKK